MIGFGRVEGLPLAPLWALANARVAKANLMETCIEKSFKCFVDFHRIPTVSQLSAPIALSR